MDCIHLVSLAEIKKRNKYYHDGAGKQLAKINYIENRERYLVQAMKQRGYEHLTVEQLITLTKNFQTDNGKNVCPYCDREIKSYTAMQYDHLIPFSEGGADILTNLIPSCEYCNRSKMDMRFSDWYRDQYFYNVESEKKILAYFYGRKLKKFFPKGYRGQVINNNQNETDNDVTQLKIGM